MKKITAVFLFVVLFFAFNQALAGMNVLRNLGVSTGAEPSATLIRIDDALYGTTYHGGDYDGGAVFKIDIEDAENPVHSTLHSFTTTVDGGDHPNGGLTYNDGMLYGITRSGGADDSGIIFSLPIEGGDITILHSFDGDAGNSPFGNISLSGTTFYGVTEEGGVDGYGVVYKIETDGSDFSVIHEFDYDDGAYPHAAPLVSADGNTLYGTTLEGGLEDSGTIYKIDITDPADPIFSVLHAFNYDEGAYPEGELIFSADGNTLYGMTPYGGGDDYGVVYAIGIDGAGFENIFDFADAEVGEAPYGKLILDGTKLYGMSDNTIFYIDLSIDPEDPGYFIPKRAVENLR